MRHLALGLAAAGVMVAGLLTAAGHLYGSSPLQAGEPTAPEARTPTDRDGGGVRVDAPGAVVDVDRQRGRFSVRAPHTDVDVDADNGHVKVRVPYVSLDIRW
jgi:hypothetical protein